MCVCVPPSVNSIIPIMQKSLPTNGATAHCVSGLASEWVFLLPGGQPRRYVGCPVQVQLNVTSVIVCIKLCSLYINIFSHQAHIHHEHVTAIPIGPYRILWTNHARSSIPGSNDWTVHCRMPMVYNQIYSKRIVSKARFP